MSCLESEEIAAAPPPPGFSTPTKSKSNDGAGHAESDDARMETESEAYVEKQFGKLTGKKQCYAGPLVHRIIKQWTTGPTATKEAKVIDHEIYTEMKLYMHASCLEKTPGHLAKPTDIHL